MVVAAAQRKFRNKEERDANCRDVVSEAVRSGMSLDSEPMLALLAAFSKYADATTGADVAGEISADEIRPGSRLEYLLPGRRIKKPLVRLTSRDPS
jgi:hypothetical protein